MSQIQDNVLNFNIATAGINDELEYLNVNIEVSSKAQRKPLALIALIDISGSMGDYATSSGKKEEVLLTRLQLVQHSLKTIVSCLEECDMVSFITFDDITTVNMPLTFMKDSSKQQAISIIDDFKPRGCTNIWLALEKGIKVSQSVPAGYNTNIMLFTDGLPNEGPEIIPALQKVLPKVNRIFNISTFGYGYNVDTKLLDGICKLGDGIYGYCPDCTMVGTIFINYLATMMSTAIFRAILTVNSRDISINLGIGQKRHFLFQVQKQKHQVTLFYDGKVKNATCVPLNPIIYNDELCKYRLVSLMRHVLRCGPTPNSDEYVRRLKDEFSSIQQTDFVKAIMLDMVDSDPNHGQIEKAVQGSNYKKWGYNYLSELCRFHILSTCGNFKDESLQLYATDKFNEHVETANQIFLSIPPPVGHKVDQAGHNITVTNFSMSNFYDRYGGCFDGDAKAKLSSGEMKAVRELKKGDVLSTGGVIECVVKSKTEGAQKIVVIDGVKFSPYHPIVRDEKWVFPCDVGRVEEEEIGYWYNVVLESGTEIELNGVRAITLGHNRKEGILEHPYFGSHACIDALKKYSTYREGFVTVDQPKIERDSTTNLIISYY